MTTKHAEPETHDHAHHGHADKPGPPVKAEPGATYTCPMHPKVRQQGPGACPLWGMALEPVTVDAHSDAEDGELKAMTRRFIVAAALLRARALSEATMANIKENLIFAFAYNCVGIPIAAGVLYPLVGVLMSPMIAAAAMSLSSVSVIGNALRLRRVKLDG